MINAPVLGGDYVTTGDASRAEIQLDAATALRLSSNVQMRFTHLDTANREVALAEGTLELSLLRAADGRLQIDTPSVSVAPRMAGTYRVSVGSDGRTHVTVRSGRADVISPQLVQALLPGTTLVASGSASNPSIASEAAVAYDDFDRFNDDRDRAEARALANAASRRPAMAGIDDLDTYGRWVTDAPYGRVWVPYATSVDWAPYRDGRWVWEDRFGWTWIGYEPWGWAPYHYGRWYHHAHYGWCWYPQRTFVVWRPALVGFLTFGNGFGPGFGNVAWVPLAPFEPYYPWWGPRYGSTTIVNNVTYVTNNYYGHVNHGQFTRSYGNARYNGVTYLPHHRFEQGSFERGRPIASSQLRSIEVVRGPLPIVPSTEHLRFSDRPVGAQLAVKTALLQRSFAGDAAPVVRVPFAQQRNAVAQVTRAAIGARNVTAHRRGRGHRGHHRDASRDRPLVALRSEPRRAGRWAGELRDAGGEHRIGAPRFGVEPVRFRHFVVARGDALERRRAHERRSACPRSAAAGPPVAAGGAAAYLRAPAILRAAAS